MAEEARVRGRSPQGLGWTLIWGWAVFALLIDIFWMDLYDRLAEIFLLFPLALCVGAVWLACSFAARGFRERAWTPAVLLLAALVAVGTLQAWVGKEIGVLVRFHALKPRYEAIVKAIEAGEVPSAGTRFIVEKGPPARVAFPWPGGILDNWRGVVYDPSGLLRKTSVSGPDMFSSSDPAVRDAIGWFGGQMRRCEALGGDWYFCYFT